MSNKFTPSRRTFVKTAAASVGTVVGTRFLPAFAQAGDPNRLRVALTPPANQVTVGYLGQNADTGPLLAMYECPVITDRFTGEVGPGLATGWETSADGKTWRVTLRPDITFHDGSPFGAADIPFSWKLLTSPESRATSAGAWRSLIESEDSIEITGDLEVVFHLANPEPELPFYLSRSQGFLIYSSAYWEKVGEAGYIANPVGTGPFKFRDFREGEYMLYDRVENHWRQTPEFAELQLLYMPEDATRLAALLAGEVQIAEVPRSIQSQAVARGMSVARSTRAAVQLFFAFGGNYISDIGTDKAGPMTERKVREAMNLAINRQEINDEIYDGHGVIEIVQPYQESDPEFDSNWKPYPFDPDKARALLAEAGYPDGFEFDMTLVQPPGFPEFPTVVEAVAIYFKNIGLKPNIKQMEISELVDMQRSSTMHGTVNSNRNSIQPLSNYIPNYYTSSGFGHYYENPFIEERVAKLKASIDPDERLQLLRQIGNHLYEENATMPILFLYAETLINPEFVAEYNADIGAFGASVDHEYTKRA